MKVQRALWSSLLIAGCAASSAVVKTYEDPAFTATVAKILVVGAHEDRGVRGQFENSVVRALRASGADGESSLAVMGSSEQLSADTLLAAARRAGADAVLVTRVLDVQARNEVRGGGTAVDPVRRDDTPFVDFFRYDYVEYQDPLSMTTTHTVVVGNDLYTVANQAKVWSAESKAVDKENLFAVIDSITSAVTGQLRSDRLIP
jgi:hypothetical protein